MGDVFQSREDIANLALQICKQRSIVNFSDNSKNAVEIARAYEKLRESLLQRDVWTFACRRTRLWPVSTTTLLFTPPAWAVGTAYVIGDIVSSGGNFWQAKQANTGKTPGADISGLLYWDLYFGPSVAQYWNLPTTPGTANTTPTSYFRGEIVYKTPGDGTYKVYVSLVDANTKTPDAVDAWDSTILYMAGDVVSSGGTNYQSLVNVNFNQAPATHPSAWTTTITNATVSGSWHQITSATLAPVKVVWPFESGPVEEIATKNAFYLPSGFEREAPQDPGAGRISRSLGFPSRLPATDWEKSGPFLISSATMPLLYRFVADVQDVTTMDALFCRLLAASIAKVVAPNLVEDGDRKDVLMSADREFTRSFRDAIRSNSIEQGPIFPPLDDYITCRM